jgi:hypothetical protein
MLLLRLPILTSVKWREKDNFARGSFPSPSPFSSRYSQQLGQRHRCRPTPHGLLTHCSAATPQRHRQVLLHPSAPWTPRATLRRQHRCPPHAPPPAPLTAHRATLCRHNGRAGCRAAASARRHRPRATSHRAGNAGAERRVPLRGA